MGTQVHSITMSGNSGTIIDIECHLSHNLPTIVIVGYANKAVEEAKERLRGAFAQSKLDMPRKRVIINLAPADIPKADSGLDLAIAVSILESSGQIPLLTNDASAFVGELGLDGRTRAVRGIIGKILSARARGITTFYIPADNLGQAQLVPQVVIVPVQNLRQLVAHLNGQTLIDAVHTQSGQAPPNRTSHNVEQIQLSQVVGQTQAKRALEIAVAGGHNVFLSGPPGVGKSMLAKCLPDLMPPLAQEEMLEVTHLHSLASNDYDQIITQRPFRAPHHSSSHVAIIGGGVPLRPGEISLAHRGILFFDEFPEFNRLTLEALRQPLEDKLISVARAKDMAEYPANFILIGTANPCPCGFYGIDGATCRCAQFQINQYQLKVSGPIMDRIDLYASVVAVEHESLLTQTSDQVVDDEYRARIATARARQTQRFGRPDKLNSDMTNRDINHTAKVNRTATSLLNDAAGRLNFSARAYMRAVRVARTIADIAGSDEVQEEHVSEALAFKQPLSGIW